MYGIPQKIRNSKSSQTIEVSVTSCVKEKCRGLGLSRGGRPFIGRGEGEMLRKPSLPYCTHEFLGKKLSLVIVLFLVQKLQNFTINGKILISFIQVRGKRLFLKPLGLDCL